MTMRTLQRPLISQRSVLLTRCSGTNFTLALLLILWARTTNAFQPLSHSPVAGLQSWHWNDHHQQTSQRYFDPPSIAATARRQTLSQRFVSATVDPTNSNTTSGNGESISTTAADGPPPHPQQQQQQQRNLDMPWSKSQEFALRDRLGRFTITVPIVNDINSESEMTETTMQTFTLWRALVEDVTELAGYPLSFLVQRAAELRSEQQQEQQSSSSLSSSFNNEILPFLDDFTFEANGGLSGRIYGISGVADGTRIQTTAVTNVELTLPKRFVRTADGSVVYELGQPAATTVALDTSPNSMAQRVAATASILPSIVVEDGSNTNQNTDSNNELVLDSDLVNIAGLTALVMAGAAAMGSLSHHLTVNVFWV